MLRIIITFGLIIAAGALCLAVMQYHFVLLSGRTEMYAVGVAIIFLALGLWAGRTFVVVQRERKSAVIRPFQAHANNSSIGGELSEREVEVLIQMAAGLTNREIADVLYVSANTVKTHVANIFSKLGVQRRVQAIHQAVELGIITQKNENLIQGSQITRSGDV
ncbi:MAG: response regulator transcription factor [Candidatus Kapabacteria bacterium]|nr:response regulator transcription factor [Candidatus Kapabacteria bacterium]